jgi:sigma-E factor negative regulatory protein RseC
MRNVGYVVNLKEDLAEIMLGRHAECKRCGACLASLDQKQRKLLAENGIGARAGQRVEVEIRPIHAVGAAFLIFIMPVISGLAGGFLGYRISQSIGWPVTAGAIGLGCLAFASSFLLLRSVERAGSQARLATIVRILPDEDAAEGRC